MKKKLRITGSLKEEMLVLFKEVLDSKFEEFNIHSITLTDTVGNMKTTIAEQKIENKQLKKKCELLKSENLKCRDNINDLQQYLRMDSLKITGCPETKNEDVYMILESIANGIHVPFIKTKY